MVCALLVLTDPVHLPIIRPMVEDDCQISFGPSPRLSRSLGEVRIGFVESRPTRAHFDVADTVGLTHLLCTRSPRRVPRDWSTGHHTSVSHTLVGGVTQGVVCISCIRRSSQPTLSPSPLPAFASRDASTVLGLKASCWGFRPAPASATVTPLCARSLGTTRESVLYHGGGWLPYPLHRRVHVLTPSLFAPKGQWGIRTLTQQEILECLDWPVALATLDCHLS